MSKLRRIVLLRHGDTDGDSSSRFHGSGDVALSETGRQQVREAARTFSGEVFDVVVASPLRRSWESARIVAGGAPVRLEDGFREIHFGRWEGMTAEEIQAADPTAYQEWQSRRSDFEFPSGEPRAEFRARVLAGLERLQQAGLPNALLVVHKGVIRTIAEHLLGEPLPDDEPALGQAVALTRGANDEWFLGKRGSDPEGLAA
ncbi:MAG: histidine phosphatase family protein [Myxococcota bacterium]